MSDLYALDTDSGLFLRKPTNRQVTMIRFTSFGADLQVVEPIDEVVERLNNNADRQRFTDVYGEPVYVFPFASVIAVYVQYIDAEAVELAQQESEIGKRFKKSQLAQASFEAAKAERKADYILKN